MQQRVVEYYAHYDYSDELDLSDGKLKKENLASILVGLTRNKNVNSLNLSKCELTDGDCKVIAQFLKQNTNISRLNLRGNLFTDKGLYTLCESLHNDKVLLELLLDENKNLTAVSYGIFNRLLNNNRHLATLFAYNIAPPNHQDYIDPLIVSRNRAILFCFMGGKGWESAYSKYTNWNYEFFVRFVHALYLNEVATLKQFFQTHEWLIPWCEANSLGPVKYTLTDQAGSYKFHPDRANGYLRRLGEIIEEFKLERVRVQIQSSAPPPRLTILSSSRSSTSSSKRPVVVQDSTGNVLSLKKRYREDHQASIGDVNAQSMPV